jgi:hypothetical protein
MSTSTRGLRRLRVALAAGALVAGATALGLVGSLRPITALAACHHFTVKGSPSTVTAGGTVTVTVSRDGNLAPSNVDVSTVDESAKAGQDYQSVSRTLSFTTETVQSFALPTMADTETAAETFRLHLSNPGGCRVNTNFVLDPDVAITIQGAASTSAPATSSVPAGSAAPSPAPAAAPAVPNTGGGPGTTLTTGLILVALGVGAGGLWIFRRQTAAGRR